MDKVLIGNYLNQIEYYVSKIRVELLKEVPVMEEKVDLNEFSEYQEIHDMTTRPFIGV